MSLTSVQLATSDKRLFALRQFFLYRSSARRRASNCYVKPSLSTSAAPMSLPGAVFLDTSILAGQQYNFGSSAIATFIPVARTKGLKLLLPDPTEREIKRHFRELSDEATAALETARKKNAFLARWKDYPKHLPGIAWDLRASASEDWTAFLRNFDVQRLGYEGVEVAKIMNWYDSSTAPFAAGKKRKEFPDAFVVAMLEAFSRAQGVAVAVVSDDEDLKRACDRFASLLHFKSLPALTELLLADEKSIEELRKNILADVPKIEEALLAEAREFEYYHTGDEHQVRDSSVHSVVAGDIRIVALGHRECTLAFEAELEAEHLLGRRSWSNYVDDYVDDEQWIVESAPFGGTIKVRLDASGHIEEVGLIETDIASIEVTETISSRGW